MTTHAILFDVGGPLDTEIDSEPRNDAAIAAAFAAEGVRITPAAYASANDHAVASFAPSAYDAIILHLAGGDVALAVRAAARFRASVDASPHLFTLRDGIPDLLSDLHARGVRLGLAANQPLRVLPVLDAYGIGRYFHHREVSGTHGYRKPDVRLFLRACKDLRVEPVETIMVGDRIDNDIAPAKLLGMRTVLFRTGRHIKQQPRSIDELPDGEVHNVDELRRVLDGML